MVRALSTIDLRIKAEAVKQRFNDYRYDDREVETQQERYERLLNKMYEVGAQALSDTPRSPSPANDRVSEFVSRKEDLEKEIGELVVHHREERAHIERLVKALKRPDQRAVIRIRVIDGMGWPDVSDVLFGENKDFVDEEEKYKRKTFRIFNEALLGIAKYIDESGDDFLEER